MAPLGGWLGDRFGFRHVLVGALALGGTVLALMPFVPTVGTLAAAGGRHGRGDLDRQRDGLRPAVDRGPRRASLVDAQPRLSAALRGGHHRAGARVPSSWSSAGSLGRSCSARPCSSAGPSRSPPEQPRGVTGAVDDRDCPRAGRRRRRSGEAAATNGGADERSPRKTSAHGWQRALAVAIPPITRRDGSTRDRGPRDGYVEATRPSAGRAGRQRPHGRDVLAQRDDRQQHRQPAVPQRRQRQHPGDRDGPPPTRPGAPHDDRDRDGKPERRTGSARRPTSRRVPRRGSGPRPTANHASGQQHERDRDDRGRPCRARWRGCATHGGRRTTAARCPG